MLFVAAVKALSTLFGCRVALEEKKDAAQTIGKTGQNGCSNHVGCLRLEDLIPAEIFFASSLQGLQPFLHAESREQEGKYR